MLWNNVSWGVSKDGRHLQCSQQNRETVIFIQAIIKYNKVRQIYLHSFLESHHYTVDRSLYNMWKQSGF